MNRLLTIPGLINLVAFSITTYAADQPQSLNSTLEPYLKEFGLPALSAAAFKNGDIIAAGAVGTRRAGENLPVTIDDKFHLGSDSKAFTALLAGMYVQQGKLRWDSTLAEIFPELKETMDPEFAKITVEELLSHSSGLADKDLLDLVNRSYQQDGNMDDVRYWMLKETAPKPLDHPRGSKFSYSNLGYTLAGVILERLSGKTWEELVEEKIFEPMGFQSAGFGPQASLGQVDATLGHFIIDGKPKAMFPMATIHSSSALPAPFICPCSILQNGRRGRQARGNGPRRWFHRRSSRSCIHPLLILGYVKTLLRVLPRPVNTR